MGQQGQAEGKSGNVLCRLVVEKGHPLRENSARHFILSSLFSSDGKNQRTPKTSESVEDKIRCGGGCAGDG